VTVSSLTQTKWGGLALPGSDMKYIYYFGGLVGSKEVHKLNIDTNVTARLPVDLSASVKLSGGVTINGTMFIFNGQGRNILEFNQDFGTGKIIGDLPFLPGGSDVYSTTAIPNGKGDVWIVAGNNPRTNNPVLLFNATTKIVTVPSGNKNSFPTLTHVPASVTDGKHGYIIGGLGRLPESDGSYHRSNGILRFSDSNRFAFLLQH
jgi:hypothetical protein